MSVITMPWGPWRPQGENARKTELDRATIFPPPYRGEGQLCHPNTRTEGTVVDCRFPDKDCGGWQECRVARRDQGELAGICKKWRGYVRVGGDLAELAGICDN